MRFTVQGPLEDRTVTYTPNQEKGSEELKVVEREKGQALRK